MLVKSNKMSNENDHWGWFVEVEYVYLRPTKQYKQNKFIPKLKPIRETPRKKHNFRYSFKPTTTTTTNIYSINIPKNNHQKHININLIFMIIIVMLSLFVISIKIDTLDIIYYLI